MHPAPPSAREPQKTNSEGRGFKTACDASLPARIGNDRVSWRQSALLWRPVTLRKLLTDGLQEVWGGEEVQRASQLRVRALVHERHVLPQRVASMEQHPLGAGAQLA